MVSERIEPASITNQPFFAPWIGDEYDRRRDASLADQDSCCDGLWHIMGESHYGESSDRKPNFTQAVVEELALSGYRFFDTIISIAADIPVADLQREREWGRFAYSNFVQDILPDEDRRPHNHHWNSARDAFFGQLAITRPKQLLVVGKTVWDNLPIEGYTPIDPFRVMPDWDEVEAGIYAYDVGGQTAFTIATWIYHPSSRGRLDVELARSRVRSVTMAGCNILSDLKHD